MASSPVWLVVCNKAPFKVLAASPDFSQLLEFEAPDVCGRSIRSIFGPLTNVGMLRQAILASSETPSFAAACMLYTKTGQGRMITVEIVPAQNGEGEVSHCVMTMDHSDWVPKKVAVAEDTRAKLVLMAEKPFSVQNVSNHFVTLYDMPAESLVGRTLQPIFGPRTDIKALHSLLALAKTGKTQNLSLWTCKPDMSNLLVHVTIFPVVEQGQVLHFMVVFKGAIDVKSHANRNLEGAKVGPPKQTDHDDRARLTPSSGPSSAQHEPSLSATKTEGSLANGSRPGENKRPAEELEGCNTSQHIPARTAEMVRTELDKRQGGVQGLITQAYAEVEFTEDEPNAANTQAQTGSAPVDDEDERAGMVFRGQAVS